MSHTPNLNNTRFKAHKQQISSTKKQRKINGHKLSRNGRRICLCPNPCKSRNLIELILPLQHRDTKKREKAMLRPKRLNGKLRAPPRNPRPHPHHQSHHLHHTLRCHNQGQECKWDRRGLQELSQEDPSPTKPKTFEHRHSTYHKEEGCCGRVTRCTRKSGEDMLSLTVGIILFLANIHIHAKDLPL